MKITIGEKEMTKGKTTNNGLFRKKKVYFSQVSNEALRDQELSLKAKNFCRT